MGAHEQKKKFFFPKIFRGKEKKVSNLNTFPVESSAMFQEKSAFSVSNSPIIVKSFSERNSSTPASMHFRGFSSPLSNIINTRSFRVFTATWNVAGKSPNNGLDLSDFLPAGDESDIYVLGFQEIVPLNAGNVLVMEDNEPATKWLYLINQALNKPQMTQTTSCPNTPLYYKNSFSSPTATTETFLSRSNTTGSLMSFQKPSLKSVSKTFRTDKGGQLKTCNCKVTRKSFADTRTRSLRSFMLEDDSSEEEAEPRSFFTRGIAIPASTAAKHKRYSLVASKQMVGIFVTVWVRTELVQHIGHMRVSCIGRGIMGYLGNKGCISVSMSLHQTSFCFVCSHLASGEKEGDHLRRNSDVIEILKNTQFPKICKIAGRRNPERILEHDRVMWLGDLNYRIALSYSETRMLVRQNDWSSLFEKDQLKMEQEAGRVFNGWNEGKIYFAPTYKYSNNSDTYTGDTLTSKKSKKKRTPAWCDRVLWHGDGIVQLSYIRGESRFSDHRPVCAVFSVKVSMVNDGLIQKGFSTPNMKIGEVLTC